MSEVKEKKEIDWVVCNTGNNPITEDDWKNATPAALPGSNRGSGSKPKTDPRVRVTDYKGSLYVNIGKVIARIGRHSYTGSGYITRRPRLNSSGEVCWSEPVLVTCAHVVSKILKSPKLTLLTEGKFRIHIKDMKGTPFDLEFNNVACFPKYTGNMDSIEAGCDYAIASFKNIPEKLKKQFMPAPGIHDASETLLDQIKRSALRVSGYPGEPPDFMTMKGKITASQKFHSVPEYPRGMIHSDLFVSKGQSGSPAFLTPPFTKNLKKEIKKLKKENVVGIRCGVCVMYEDNHGARTSAMTMLGDAIKKWRDAKLKEWKII